MKFSGHFLRVLIASAAVAMALAQTNERNRTAKDGGPEIVVTDAPPYDCGGPDKMDSIAGKVTGVTPNEYRITIYAQACNGIMYVQPTVASPVTDIGSEGSFEATIHLGQTYYVLLVRPTYKPPAELTRAPQKCGDVLAVARVHGRGAPGDAQKK